MESGKLNSLYRVGTYFSRDKQILCELITMLIYYRKRTFSIIENLSIQQLDFVIQDGLKIENSIGSLLMHIASTELYYQNLTLKSVKLDLENDDFWVGSISKNLHKKLYHSNDVSYYKKILENVRSETLKQIITKQDKWLDEDTYASEDTNNHYCWIHVIEDELCHLGQIKYIINRFNDDK